MRGRKGERGESDKHREYIKETTTQEKMRKAEEAEQINRDKKYESTLKKI